MYNILIQFVWIHKTSTGTNLRIYIWGKSIVNIVSDYSIKRLIVSFNDNYCDVNSVIKIVTTQLTYVIRFCREQMPLTTPGQLTVEKTPSYFVTRDVPKKVFNMSRNVKLIVVVRDPVVRAISDYTQAASKRPGMKPFEQMALLDNRTGLVNSSWGAVRIGVYPKHLDRWLKHFPLRQFHFVSGERLIVDPAGEMAKVQDFLGLERVITDKHFYLNQTRGFPCLKKPGGSGKPHCLGKTKGRQHPSVDPHVLQRLRDFYKPFNLKFYQMVGQNFRWPTWYRCSKSRFDKNEIEIIYYMCVTRFLPFFLVPLYYLMALTDRWPDPGIEEEPTPAMVCHRCTETDVQEADAFWPDLFKNKDSVDGIPNHVSMVQGGSGRAGLWAGHPGIWASGP